MARYETDELNAAQEDLFNAEVMIEVVGRCKDSLRIRAAELNKNGDLVDHLCQHIDEAMQDTLRVIIGLAKDAGAEHSRDHLVITAAQRGAPSVPAAAA